MAVRMDPDPLIVVGLGNPGTDYGDTRHNTGFMVVDLLARRAGSRFRVLGDWSAAEIAAEGRRLVLVKPLTYMNNSGWAAAGAVTTYAADPGRVLVVLDDVAIPLGTLRLRSRGSDGGHNGLRSVLAALGTEAVPRLRCGIGQETPVRDLSEFVLSPFDRQEQEAVRTMVKHAADAVLAVVRTGVEQAMNVVNA